MDMLTTGAVPNALAVEEITFSFPDYPAARTGRTTDSDVRVVPLFQ
jgi:hypothetical protein